MTSLSPESRAVMDTLAAVYPRVDEIGDPVRCRQILAELPPLEGPAVKEVTAVEIPSDPPVRARVYCPEGDSPVGVLVYLHGGGWVLGTVETHDNVARELAVGAGIVVVSVDYRLAPEHPYPAPLDDVMAAVRWGHDHAAEWGAPARVAVGGDSAGGNLAAAACLRARDEGGPPLAFQLLVYPALDAAMDTESYRAYGTDHFLTASGMAYFWEAYEPDPDRRLDRYHSPLRADDLVGLPPALVITASCDPLRDEGEVYARRLDEAGVPVRLRRQDDVFHGFFSLGQLFPPAMEAIGEAAGALREALAGG